MTFGMKLPGIKTNLKPSPTVTILIRSGILHII